MDEKNQQDELSEEAEEQFETARDAERAAAQKVGVKFAEEDRFEVWAWISLGLAATAAVAIVVAFLRLGTASVWAYQEMLFYCGIGTVLMSFWGLVRTFFNPPVLRRSRTIAFGTLLVVGYFTLSTPFNPPLSTDDWTTTETVALPFDGEWMTLAGGKWRESNFYARYPAMRWAFAFAPIEDGKTFKGDGPTGARVEDYLCWGKPVLSPVAGEVVSYEGGMADVGMEEAPTGTLLGNHVGIKFGESDFMFVSNLMEKSVKVRPGDMVEVGQHVGDCGRSGYTPEPLIVVHAQNTLNFPVSEGLPVRFTTYRLGDETVKKGMPRGTTDWGGKLNGHLVSNPN